MGYTDDNIVSRNCLITVAVVIAFIFSRFVVERYCTVWYRPLSARSCHSNWGRLSTVEYATRCNEETRKPKCVDASNTRDSLYNSPFRKYVRLNRELLYRIRNGAAGKRQHAVCCRLSRVLSGLPSFEWRKFILHIVFSFFVSFFPVIRG